MARRMLALLTALLLVASLPLAVLADEWNLDNGDVTVSVNAEGTQHVSQGENKKEDAAPTIKGGNGSQSITVSTTGENKANLTIENVNAKTIDVGASNATITVSGSNTVTNNDGAGIHVSSGDLTITGNGILDATGNMFSAGIGSGQGEAMSGSITIKEDTAYDIVVAGRSSNGAGIGSGLMGDMSGSITIEGDAHVTGDSGFGAGIGSGLNGDMSGNISITMGAPVYTTNENIGAGFGGTMSGKFWYFEPEPTEPQPTEPEPTEPEPTEPQPTEPEPTDPAPTQPAKTPLYRVLNERGEPLSCTKELADGVLTITVDGDFAKLIGTVLSLKTLEKQGVTTITLVTGSATSTFSLADIQAKGTGTYTLTHDKETVTFTLAKADVSDVLK